MRRILIVGGGVAGAALVSSLRRRGFTGEITALSEEKIPPYDRPPLSKDLFVRNQPSWLLDELNLPDDAATWVLGTRATALVPGGVEDSHGHVWHADDVVIATGLTPRSPWPGTRTLSTWDDAVALREALGHARRVAIVGAGWLGLELASVAASRGVGVTLFDAAEGPLGAVLPRTVSERISGWVRDAGVEFIGSSPVSHAEGDHVITRAGTERDADCVIVALGSTPLTDWLPPELRAPSGHIIANGDGRVRDGLWAVGDCAIAGGRANPHWNDAIASAERCAAAITDDPTPAPRAPHGYSTLFGRDVQVLGEPSPDLELSFTDTPAGWTAQMTHDGELTAVIAVDSPREVAKARKALAPRG